MKTHSQKIIGFFTVLIACVLLLPLANATFYSNGSDGNFSAINGIITTTLINNTDYTYTNNSGIITINFNLNRIYQFDNLYTDNNTIISTQNTTGAVLYLTAMNNIEINGTINLTGKLTQQNNATLNGETIYSSAIANGGNGGDTTYGGKTNQGYGGGGASGYCLNNVGTTVINRQYGGNGSTNTPINGNGSTCTGIAGNSCGADGTNGLYGGGAGGSVLSYDGGSGHTGTGGTGGNRTTINGSSGSTDSPGWTNTCAGGGGGVGGTAGNSTPTLYLLTNNLKLQGTIDTRGKNGGNGGKGGDTYSYVSGGIGAHAGAGGGGGGGSSGGTIYLSYYGSYTNTGTIINTKGTGGTAGARGSVSGLNGEKSTPYNATAGTDGNNGNTYLNIQNFTTTYSGNITNGSNNYVRNLTTTITYSCNGNNTNILRIINSAINNTFTATCDNTIRTLTDTYTHPTEGTYNISYNLHNQQTFISDLYNPTTDAHVKINYTGNTAALNLTCTDTIYSPLLYNMVFNGATLYYNNKTNATTQTNTTSSLVSLNTYTASCSDLFGTTTNTTSSLVGQFTFWNEKFPSQKFNMTKIVSIILDVSCLEGTANSQTYVINNSTSPGSNYTTEIPACTLPRFSFRVGYPTTSYFRTTLFTPSEVAAGVNVFLIEDTTDALYNSLVIDDLLEQYINPRLYTYKTFNNVQYEILADKVDNENKVAAYFLENTQYTFQLQSDNRPTASLGFYSASVAGEKTIRLYVIDLSPATTENMTYFGIAAMDYNKTTVGAVTATLYAPGGSVENAVTNSAFNIYNTNYSGTPFYSASATGSSAIYTFVVNGTIYENSTMYGDLVIQQANGNVMHYRYPLQVNMKLHTKFRDLVGQNALSWFILIVLSTVAIYTTVSTNRLVMLAIGLLEIMLIGFGFLPANSSVIATAVITIILGLVTSLKQGDAENV